MTDFHFQNTAERFGNFPWHTKPRDNGQNPRMISYVIYSQGRKRRDATGENVPTRLNIPLPSPPMVSYPPMRSRSSEFSGHTHEAYRHLGLFKLSETTHQYTIPSRGHLQRAGSHIKSRWGPVETMGPHGLMHTFRKALALSLFAYTLTTVHLFTLLTSF